MWSLRKHSKRQLEAESAAETGEESIDLIEPEEPGWWAGPDAAIESEFVALAQSYGLSADRLGRMHRFLATHPDAARRMAGEMRPALAALPADHMARQIFDTFSETALTEHLDKLYTNPLDQTMMAYLDLRFSERIYELEQIGTTLPYLFSVPMTVHKMALDAGLTAEQVDQLTLTVHQTGTCLAMVAMRVFIRARDQELGRLHDVADCSIRLAEVGTNLRDTAMDEQEGLGSNVERARDGLGELDSLAAQVVSTIDGIRQLAEKTNLLALNATIEASRAGEHGRGFGVVANEVKALAGNTKEALHNIEQLASRISSGVDDAISHMGHVDRSAATVVESANQISALSDDLQLMVSNQASG